MSSIQQYRKKPIKEHSKEDRNRYVADMKRLHQDKMKKGTKILVNVRGENIEGVINKDATPQNTSLEVILDGKVVRKDIATIYGIEGDKPKAKGSITMKAPGMTKLPPSSMVQFDIKKAVKKGKVAKVKAKVVAKPKAKPVDKPPPIPPKPKPKPPPPIPPKPKRKVVKLEQATPSQKVVPKKITINKPSKAKKTMSASHKQKISAGVKKYHSTCKGGKNSSQVKQLKAEVNKLRNMIK